MKIIWNQTSTGIDNVGNSTSTDIDNIFTSTISGNAINWIITTS